MAAPVSIGLPVHNGEKYLPGSLESILAQTCRDFELLISDNASTDGTQIICHAYAARDERIRYYRQARNIGSARNFNAVFALSRGVYFKWMAADDEIEPEFLARCVATLESDRKAVLAHPRAIIIDEFRKETRSGTFRYELADLCAPRPSQRLRDLFLYGSVYPIFGLIRSSALKKTPCFRSCIGADFCLLVDLLLQGKFAEVPEYLMKLRAHAGAYSCGVTTAIRSGRRDPARQVFWWDPEVRGTTVMPYWRRLREHFLSVVRSQTGMREKAAMFSFLCHVGNWWRDKLCAEGRSAIFPSRRFENTSRPAI